MASDERRRAYSYLGLGTLIIGAILGGNAYLKMRPKPAIDDGCLKTITGKAVILIDHSKDVTEQTNTEIVSRAVRFIENETQVGDLVSVFAVSDLSTRNLKPLFSYCKPNSDGNPLFESRRNVEQDFKTKFEIPLKNALAIKISGAQESPIAQAVIDLSLSEFMRGAPRTYLLLFSDMLEHTKGFSMYKCTATSAGIENFRESRLGSVQRPTFKNVAVYTNIIPRKDITRAALACRDGFWVWFFGDNSGPGARLIPDELPG